MTVSEKLRAGRVAKKMTQAQVGEKIGKSPKVVGHWETGYAQPDADTLGELLKLYELDANDFFNVYDHGAKGLSADAMAIARDYDGLDVYGKRAVRAVLEEEKRRVGAQILPTSDKKVLPFRLSEQSASAGTGTYLGPEEFILVSVLDKPLTRRASFGVPVKGNSMEPTYKDGDILLIEAAPDVEIGEIGVFTVDGQAYVKMRGDGVLVSLNKEYGDIPLDDSARCNGRVIGVLDKDWIV